MSSLKTLTLEANKLKEQIAKQKSEIAKLEKEKEAIKPNLQKAQDEVIAKAKKEFETNILSAGEAIDKACSDMRIKVEALLDTFPELQSEEYAGRYEVKTLESHLEEIYPQEFIESYICLDPITFDSEGEAYKVYSRIERNVMGLKQRNLSGFLFNTLVGLFNSQGVGSRVSLGILGLFCSFFVLFPFVALSLFSLIAVCSISQGFYIKGLLRRLYSVKAFLNESYDEDIFQQDKSDIMGIVDKFLEDTKEEYLSTLGENEFIEPIDKLRELEESSEKELSNRENRIALGNQKLLGMQKNLEELTQEIQRLIEEQKSAAEKARSLYLETMDWKMEWLQNLFLDVTQDNKIIQAPWTKGNSIYYGESLDNVQNLTLLAVFQCALHMHPSLCSQVIIDYKYLGSNLVQFAKLPAIVCDLCTDDEKIDKKMASLIADMRSRSGSILQTCASIEDFNKLMSSYGVTGESYIIVHLCGLQAIKADLKTFIKNGPKVGYYFKIYLTVEELQEISKDIPLKDFSEFVKVSDTLQSMSLEQIKSQFNIK